MLPDQCRGCGRVSGTVSSAPFGYGRDAVTTKLEKTLKREIQIKGEPYIVAISPEGLKLTQKGKRKGQELQWQDLVSGDAAMAVALNASLENSK
jgi:hypothetical protein